MKNNHNRVWRSAISIALAITLVLSSVPVAFAGSNGVQAENNIIKYVSLGDSMSNGFALPNYENQGYQGYSPVAYPNRFAAWLEKETGKDVEHSQLAISGTRIEDLHFLLDFPMKNGEPDPAAVAVAETPAAEWNEELAAKWEETFLIGDSYTWDMLSYGRWKSYCGGTDIAVKEYRKAIAEADIITMATGNSNFGVFGMERLNAALGTADEDTLGNEWFKLEQAIAVCEPELQEYFLDLKSELKTVTSLATAAMGSPELAEMADDLVDAFVYLGVSYMVHYAGTIEGILELNPDAEIVLMGIMDTTSGINIAIEQEDGTTETVTMMEIVGEMLEPVNVYIAGLPAVMQKEGNELYSQAEFYYVESPKVPVLANEFVNYINDSDSVTRDRFVEGIVGPNGTGIVWSAFAPVFNELEVLKERNLELVPVTLDDVLAYKAGKYSGLSDSEMFSCGVYFAVENGIIEASNNYAVDIDTLMSLTAGFGPQLEKIADGIDANETKIFANGADISTSAKNTEKILYNTLMSDDNIKALLHMVGRTQIGNGIGGHPSERGHDALTAAFIEAYEEGHSVSNKYNASMNDFRSVLLEAGSGLFDGQKQIVNTLKKTVNNLDSYAKAQLDGYAGVKANYAGNGFDAQLNTVEKQLKEMRKAVKSAKSAIGTLADAVSGNDAGSVESAAAVVEAKMEAIDTTADALRAAVSIAAKEAKKAGLDNGMLKNVASEMSSYVALASNTYGIMKSDYRQLTYAPVAGSLDEKSKNYNPDASYYVALGDGSAITNIAGNSYGRKLIKDLGLDYRLNFSNDAKDGMRVDDLLYILDENYEADAYSKENFSSRLDKNRAELTAKIEKADLIIVGFSNNTMLEISIGQMIKAFGGRETYDVDWSRYLDEDMAAQVTEMMAGIEASVVEATAGMSGSGINMDNIGPALRAAIESYLYNYIGFYMNYQDALNRIAEINPDAKIVLVGVSNAFDGTVLTMGDDQIPLGEYMGELVDLMNLQQKAFAMMTGKATYVDAPDVELSSNAYSGNVNILAFLSQLMLKGTDTLDTSSGGHTYIKDQIMAAMKLVDLPTETAMDKITGLYDLLNVDVSQLEAADAQIRDARSAYDDLTDAQKANVDAELVQLLEFCEADFDYLKVAAVGNSSVTNVKAKLATKTKLTVSWKGIDGAQKYTVKIYRNGALWKTVNTAKKSVSLTNVSCGCTYKVTVQPAAAINGTTFTGIAKTAAVTSKLDKANIAVKKAGVNAKVYSKDQNSTGFQVWIAKDKKFKKNVTKKTFKTNGSALKNKAVALKKGTNYIKVRAYTTIGGKTVYGAWSAVKTVKR